jgi:hypothetical protein
MCPKYLQDLYHNLCNCVQKCRIWICFHETNNQLEDDDETDKDTEILRFWVPQRSFSTQSGQC